MRIIIQRVSHASVTINGSIKSEIRKGLMILLGIAANDTPEDVRWLVKKVLSLRIFDDNEGVMNLSVGDIKGELMVVSQFTLLASCKKGNRPSWIKATKHETAIPLYHLFCDLLNRETGTKVATGEFGADMKVELVNDGPVTIYMDTANKE